MWRDPSSCQVLCRSAYPRQQPLIRLLAFSTLVQFPMPDCARSTAACPRRARRHFRQRRSFGGALGLPSGGAAAHARVTRASARPGAAVPHARRAWHGRHHAAHARCGATRRRPRGRDPGGVRPTPAVCVELLALVDDDGAAALHLACDPDVDLPDEEAALRMVELLLAYGAFSLTPRHSTWGRVHYAINHAACWSARLVQRLVQAGASIDGGVGVKQHWSRLPSLVGHRACA